MQKPEQLSEHKFSVIAGWDMSQIEQRLKWKMKWDETKAAQAVDHYRKYLMMAAANINVEFPVSELVDEAGHLHILMVDDMAAFCKALAEGDEVLKIHHQPAFSDDDCAALLPSYVALTLPTFEAMFGPVDETAWPREHCVCGWSIRREGEDLQRAA